MYTEQNHPVANNTVGTDALLAISNNEKSLKKLHQFGLVQALF